jgi:predicted dehydrogenase
VEKLRVLLLGAAFGADLHAYAYSRIRDRATIAGISNRNPERAKALAARYGIDGFQLYGDYREAIEKCDCDLVDICLPNFLHYEPAMLALKKGRNVICEKPLATSAAHGREMVGLAAEMGRHIYYGEDWMFAPAITKALEIIRGGGIGDLQYMRARECHGGSHSPYAQTIEYCGGGALVHLGIHPLGFVLAVKNHTWTHATAMTSAGGAGNMRHMALEGEDWSASLIKFEDGTAALVEANYLTCGGMEDVIDFYGTKGRLHVDLTFSSALNCFSVGGLDYTVEKAETTTGWSRPAVDERYNLGYVDEITHFVECAMENRPSCVGTRGEDGYEALRLAECLYRSAREGVTVAK